MTLSTPRFPALAGFLVLAACATARPPEPGAPRPTDAFRAEHATIREHLGHADAWVAELRAAAPDDRRARMRAVAGFFREHIVPHAEWEERSLYPVVDRHAGGDAKHPFTATMRHEHRIVGRWTAELEAEAAKPSPDADAFARRAQQLLGLVAAHFEEEEEVLLPVLDASMTAAEFHATVLGPGHGH